VSRVGKNSPPTGERRRTHRDTDPSPLPARIFTPAHAHSTLKCLSHADHLDSARITSRTSTRTAEPVSTAALVSKVPFTTVPSFVNNWTIA